MQFEIPHNTLKALLLIAAKNDRRWYLNGILLDVRANDITAVATDGHRLIAVPVTLAEGARIVGQYIIPRELLDGVKPSHKALPIGVIINDAINVTIDTGGAQLAGKLIDGTYPNWRTVVPHTVSGAAGQFNHEYVASFGKAHQLLGGKYSPTMFHNGDGAARIGLAADAVGVLMPLRESEPGPLDNPSWIDPPAPEAKAA